MSSSCSTIVGARPSDSSSIISSFGLAMNAIARPSICCSPPDRSPASWSTRSRRTGSARAPRSVAGLHVVAVASLVQPAREPEVLGDGEGREHAAAARHLDDAELGRLRSASRWVMSSPSKKIAPPRRRRRARRWPCSSVDLPAPFVPSRATISPSPHLEVDAEQHLHLVVGDVDAAAHEQRQRLAAGCARSCAEPASAGERGAGRGRVARARTRAPSRR